MSDLAKEIAEITNRYNKEIAALKAQYLKTMEGFKEKAAKDSGVPKSATGNLKEKIETDGMSYFR